MTKHVKTKGDNMLKSYRIESNKVEVYFICEDCDIRENETIFNSIQNGAPICINCGEEMSINYVKIMP